MMNIAESPCLKSIFAIWGSGELTLYNVKGPYGWLGHVCLAPAGGPKARDGHHVSA